MNIYKSDDGKILMINYIDIEDQNHGGSSYFHDGEQVDRYVREIARLKGIKKSN